VASAVANARLLSRVPTGLHGHSDRPQDRDVTPACLSLDREERPEDARSESPGSRGERGALKERVAFLHAQIGTDALIEQYIDGREIYSELITATRACGSAGLENEFGTWSRTENGLPPRG